MDDAHQAYAKGDFAEVEEITASVLRKYPDSTEAWLLRAESAEGRGDWRLAAEAYTRLADVETRPRSAARAWLNAGRLLMQGSLVQDAEHCLLIASSKDAEFAEPHRLLAQIYSVQGRSSALEREILRLIQLDEHTQSDLILFARPYPMIDDPQRRGALAQADPDFLIPRIAEARLAILGHRPDEAERLLREVIRQHPDETEAHALLGDLLVEGPEEVFRAWLSGLPAEADGDCRIWLSQGIWLRDRGAGAEAVRCFWEAFRRAPENMTAANQLALALAASGMEERAQLFFEHLHGLRVIAELTHQIDMEVSLANAKPLVRELEQRGRLWEAWAWCRLVDEDQPAEWASRKSAEIREQLAAGTPRTVLSIAPGHDIDWSEFPLPHWDSEETSRVEMPVAGQSSDPRRFRFIAQSADVGVDFRFLNGDEPLTEGKRMFESTGGGVAAIDFDRDMWPDLYFVQGGSWPVARASEAPVDQLFRNRGNGTYRDVTRSASAHEPWFGQGIAAGDFDNDGFPDLYVANLGRNRLFHNNGDGTFQDVTESAGLQSETWTMSCLMADLNGDGHPDLFDVNYIEGEDALNVICTDRDGQKRACRPTVFPAAPEVVSINSGAGTFADYSESAGLDDIEGRGMGVVAGDLDGSGAISLFIANDMTANHLLDVQGDGDLQLTFKDRGLIAGIATDQDGRTQASMGVASGDLNGDSVLDFFVTNFADESNTLYLSAGGGGYRDATRDAGLREPGYAMLGFGTEFLDADLNGQLDLLVLNGHVDDFTYMGQELHMRPQLFQGVGDVRFIEVPEDDLGDYFVAKHLGRGLAVLDWNRDGASDAVATHLDEPAVLLTNDGLSRGHFLQLQLVGRQSPRVPFGTRIRVESAGQVQHLQLTAGNGYSASHDRVLCVGLGDASRVDKLEIHWISGEVSVFRDVPADRCWIVTEGAYGDLLGAPGS